MIDMISNISFDTRKSLQNNLGEEAGKEIADTLIRMAKQISELKRSKVNVIEVVPAQKNQVEG